MKRKTFLRGMTLYTVIIVAVAILMFLLFGGRRWMGSMHNQGHDRNNQIEMRSNPK